MSFNPEQALQLARETLDIEAAALTGLKSRLDARFAQAVQMMLQVRGRVVVTGMGKSGHVGSKIAATLATLHTFPDRLLVMWQPHGYGPIRQMKDQLIEMFARDLAAKDMLFMPEPAYFGGTVDKSMGSNVIAQGVTAQGKNAAALPDRAACGDKLVEMAQPLSSAKYVRMETFFDKAMAPEQRKGLGLGLAIVKRLSDMMAAPLLLGGLDKPNLRVLDDEPAETPHPADGQEATVQE